MSMDLIDDGYCFACGKDNPAGLKLAFEPSRKGVRAFFTPDKRHQGYKDIIHGGIITTLLDEAMVQAAIRAGLSPVTAELKVRFKSALMVGQKVEVEAWVHGGSAHKLIEAASELRALATGELIATAEARLFMRDARPSEKAD